MEKKTLEISTRKIKDKLFKKKQQFEILIHDFESVVFS